MLFRGRFAIVIASLIAFKPVLDLTWNWRWTVAGRELNPQSVMGLVFAVLGVLASIELFRGAYSKLHHRIAGLFFVFLVFAGSVAWVQPSELKDTFRYVSSMAAIPLILVLRHRADPLREKVLFRGLALSLGFLVLTCVLQAVGAIPYYAKDFLPQLTGWETRVIGRMTGGYEHPLNLLRFLVWAYLFLVLALREWTDRRLWLALASLAVLDAILVRTTHRTSLVVFPLLALSLPCVWRCGKQTLLGVVMASLIGLFVVPRWVLPSFHWGTVFSWRYELMDPKGQARHEERFGTTPQVAPSQGPNEPDFRRGRYFLRGRGANWWAHALWIQRFGLREWLIGTRTLFPYEEEWRDPHQQFIDWVERFGLIGLGVLLSLLILAPIAAGASWGVAGLFWLMVLTFSCITRPLLMPSFLLFGMIFLKCDRWLRSVHDAAGRGREESPSPP